ncbi:MAG: Aminopeptidase 2 mitochondrial [Marteilia pararefringens]
MTKAEILTESEAPGKTEELSNPGRGKFLNLDSAILPEHYKIHLDFEFSTLNYYGTVELEGSLRYSPGSPQSLLTKRLQLHSRHNYITSIKVRHGAAVYQARAEQIEPDLIELIDEATNSRDFELLPANGTKVALEYRFLGQITDDFDGIYRNMIVNEKEGTVAGQNYYATTQCEVIRVFGNIICKFENICGSMIVLYE